MPQLIDLHNHLLYGVDDGAQTLEESQKMIRNACKNGITHVMLTSHAVPGQKPFPMAVYRENLERLRAWCHACELPIRLYPGSEIFYTYEAQRMIREGALPTLANRRAVLVEFSPIDPFEKLVSAARQLSNTGCKVIFAHVERYRALMDLRRVETLRKEYEIVIQVNAHTFLRKTGFGARRWMRRMMENGLVDVVASDAHNLDTRSCRLAEAYDRIKADYGVKTAWALCCANPAGILGFARNQAITVYDR